MFAVDWLLFGERACIWLALTIVIVIAAIVRVIVVGVVADWHRDRAMADDFDQWERETSNVVQFHPRTRLYNWEAEGDVS